MDCKLNFNQLCVLDILFSLLGLTIFLPLLLSFYGGLFDTGCTIVKKVGLNLKSF